MHGNAITLVSQEQQRDLLPGKTGRAQSSYFELKNQIGSQDTCSLVVTSQQDDRQNPFCAEMVLPCPRTHMDSVPWPLGPLLGVYGYSRMTKA